MIMFVEQFVLDAAGRFLDHLRVRALALLERRRRAGAGLAPVMLLGQWCRCSPVARRRRPLLLDPGRSGPWRPAMQRLLDGRLSHARAAELVRVSRAAGILLDPPPWEGVAAVVGRRAYARTRRSRTRLPSDEVRTAGLDVQVTPPSAPRTARWLDRIAVLVLSSRAAPSCLPVLRSGGILATTAAAPARLNRRSAMIALMAPSMSNLIRFASAEERRHVAARHLATLLEQQMQCPSGNRNSPLTWVCKSSQGIVSSER